VSEALMQWFPSSGRDPDQGAWRRVAREFYGELDNYG